MPNKVQVVEKYWCPGVWPWEWFDTCDELVWKWEYMFDWVKVTRYLFYCEYEGCENGTRYKWSGACLGLGSGYFAQHRHYEDIDDPLSAGGRCDSNNMGIITAPVTDEASLRKEIQIGESLKEIRSFIQDKKSFIPENVICNPKGLTVNTWTVVKDFELKLVPNKIIGYMSWIIDGINLTGSSGTLTIPNKDVYLPGKDTYKKTSVKLKCSIGSGKALTILNNGEDGNYSIMVELRIKLTNDIEDLGILVFRKTFYVEAQTIDGEENYQKYLTCFSRTKKFIADFGSNLIPPRPGASDPPGWGSVDPQTDKLKWIDEKIETLKNELKDISKNFAVRDNIK